MGKALLYFFLIFACVMGLMYGHQRIAKEHVITVFKTGVAAVIAFALALVAFVIEINLI